MNLWTVSTWGDVRDFSFQTGRGTLHCEAWPSKVPLDWPIVLQSTHELKAALNRVCIRGKLNLSPFEVAERQKSIPFTVQVGQPCSKSLSRYLRNIHVSEQKWTWSLNGAALNTPFYFHLLQLQNKNKRNRSCATFWEPGQLVGETGEQPNTFRFSPN